MVAKYSEFELMSSKYLTSMPVSVVNCASVVGAVTPAALSDAGVSM